MSSDHQQVDLRVGGEAREVRVEPAPARAHGQVRLALAVELAHPCPQIAQHLLVQLGRHPPVRLIRGRAAAPTLLGLDSWNEIAVPPDLSEVFTTPEYAQWNSLRESDNARFIALTLPRVLAREPYSQDGNAVVEEFNFIEETDGHGG